MKNKSILNKIIENSEKIAFCLLSGWCLIPVFMAIITFYNALVGNLPNKAQLSNIDFGPHGIVYMISLNTYRRLFFIFGAITIVFTLFCIINNKTVFLFKNIKSKPWFFLLFSMIIWSFISCVFADSPSYALIGDEYSFFGFFCLTTLFSIFITASIISKPYLKKRLILIFCLAMTFLSIIMFIQSFDIYFLNYCFPAINAVVFNNSNHFAYLLCMADIAYVSLYLYDNKKFNYIYLIGFSFVLYCLLINNTFGCYLAVCFGFIFTYSVYALKKRGWNLITILPIIVFIIISVTCYLNLIPFCKDTLSINFSELFGDFFKIAKVEQDFERGGTGRIVLWLQTIELIKIKPFIGVGASGLVNDYALLYNQNPHNEFLAYAVYFGIPALLLYLLSLITLAINRIKNIQKLDQYILVSSSCVFTYLVSSFFGNHVFNTAPYFWLLLGICSGEIAEATPLFMPRLHTSKSKGKPEPKKLIILSGCVVCLFLFSYYWLTWTTEKKSERADICAMDLADSMSRLLYRNKKIDFGEYWYDDENFELISVSENKPKGYGTGTKFNTNFSNIYNKVNKKDYDYDGNLDYTNKVIKVIISENSDKSLNISLVWQ